MRLLAFPIVLVLASCSKTTEGPSPPDAGDAGTVAWNRPAPRPSTGMTPTLEALPKDDGGLPILLTTPVMSPGVGVELVYDPTLDDAVARWGECLSRVAACYRTNDGKLGGCADFIEPCADNTGGTGCCPPACLAAYRDLINRGVSEREAIDQSFVAGDCVQGFREQVEEAMP